MGQRRPISVKMESGTLRAIMQPNTPCASKKKMGGNRTDQFAVARTMAAIIGPRSSAAGRCNSSKIKPNRAERPSRTTH